MKSQLNIDEAQLRRIISVAYGDANLTDKIRIYFLAVKNIEVKRVLNEYRTTAKAVKNLENNSCPDEILENVKIIAGIKGEKSFSVLTAFIHSIIYKPALSTIVFLILAACISLFVIFNSSKRNQYSEKQIQLAEKQVEQSLVLVSKIFNKTADKLENDIIKEQVAKPVYKAVSTLNELFKGG